MQSYVCLYFTIEFSIQLYKFDSFRFIIDQKFQRFFELSSVITWIITAVSQQLGCTTLPEIKNQN